MKQVSRQGVSKEEDKLIARSRQAGFSGRGLIADAARRLAQSMVSGGPRNQPQARNQPPARTASKLDPHDLAEHSGKLARKLMKFFPFHNQSVPPVDYDEGPNQDIDAMVPIELVTSETLTIAAGNTALIMFEPSTSKLASVVQFNTANMDVTFFDKTATATWPFDGATNIPLNPLMMVHSPANVRAAFGSFSNITWPDNPVNVWGGTSGNSHHSWLGGGVAIEVYANYLGNVEVSRCGPSDSPHIYGCSRPDISRTLYNRGIRENAFTNVGTGITNLLVTALPAQADEIAEVAVSGIHPAYQPPNSMPTVDDFTPKRVQQLGHLDMVQGGSQHAHKVYAWTFHTEDQQLHHRARAGGYGVWRDPNVDANFPTSANPTDFLRVGQGFIMLTATGADAKIIVKGRCHFAGVVSGSATVHTQRQDVQMFNNEDRDDCGEHESTPHAHCSFVSDTVEEALAGAGTAGLIKAGLSTPIAKQITAEITKLPIVGTAAKTAITSVESGFGWLTSHLGPLARKILPKVAVAAEDVAEAVPFLI